MRSILILVLLTAILLNTGGSPALQSQVEFSSFQVFYSFGSTATFQVLISTSFQIREAYLYIQPAADDTRQILLPLPVNGEMVFNYDLFINPLRPFSHTNYWYQIVLADGSKAESQIQSFLYADNTRDWQSLKDEIFEVYWYQGDLRFGQSVLNTAHSGLASAQKYFNAPPPIPLRIYIYANGADLRDALQLGQGSWTAGSSNPDQGIIIISIPTGPDQVLEQERQIPHEIVHILQYQQFGDDYQKLPTWLLEGTASLAELYPNPDYEIVLINAVKSNTLIPMEQLCGPFPVDASAAFLAYAQSESFTRYLYQNYGGSGLEGTMHAYLDGMGCVEAPFTGLGISLTNLESNWRDNLQGLNQHTSDLRILLPYLLLLMLLLVIPIGAGLLVLRKRKG